MLRACASVHKFDIAVCLSFKVPRTGYTKVGLADQEQLLLPLLLSISFTIPYVCIQKAQKHKNLGLFSIE